jgi:hypothetical protein
MIEWVNKNGADLAAQQISVKEVFDPRVTPLTLASSVLLVWMSDLAGLRS